MFVSQEDGISAHTRCLSAHGTVTMLACADACVGDSNASTPQLVHSGVVSCGREYYCDSK